jgi:hypothetical protein
MIIRFRLALAFCILAGAVLRAAEPAPRAIARSQFASEADASGWTPWSPREEIAPQFAFDPKGGRAGRGALKIVARAPSQFGAWRSTLGQFRSDRTYRFNAWYRTHDVENERRSVIARLQWLDANGKPVANALRPPEYPLDVAREGGWVKMESCCRFGTEARRCSGRERLRITRSSYHQATT